jgi:zinc D-Ala-D-Ala carboxypeptidase
MKLPRIVPIIGMSLALVVAAPPAHAEPSPDPAPTSEPAPDPAPEPSAPPAPSPSPAPSTSPAPTSTPRPSASSTPSPSTSSTAPRTTSPQTTTPRTTSPQSTTPRTSAGPSYTPQPNPWTGQTRTSTPPAELKPLSPDDLSEQIEQAKTLLASLAEGNAEMAALLAELQIVTDSANEALEAKAIADEVARQSGARAASSRNTAIRLADELARKHQQLRDWAFSAYSDGGSTAEMVSVFDALINDPSKAGNPVGDLAYLTDERLRLFEDIKRLTARQKAAAERAEAERAVASEAAAEAARAASAADAALRAQNEAIEKAKQNREAVLRGAGPLAAMLVGLSSEAAQAKGEEILQALMAEHAALPDLDKPCSDNTGAYPNGQLPSSALCPLWMAPDHFARPSAAVAFNALSQKFAADFGAPICVTDSYRSFTDQVAVKASRGWWAATPGTSNHGLGLALDLCGGIGSFGTIEHLWMRQNAPLFGWFHPSWAAADGVKPEPWHWEFAG